jgi:thymidylate kinase
MANMGSRTRFVIIDGLDGVGKGEALYGIIDHLVGQNQRVFDLHDFWEDHGFHPQFEDPNGKFYTSLDDFEILVSSEPTFTGIGQSVREEIIRKTSNGSARYSARFTAEQYAADRQVLYQRVLLPALAVGKTVLQSRSVSTSIVYQPMQRLQSGEEPLTIEDVVQIPGNQLALKNAPGLLIIPTVPDIDVVIERLAQREKKDDCRFENPEFQRIVKPLYESERLRRIFESRGCAVELLDASISVDKTRELGVELYRKYFE